MEWLKNIFIQESFSIVIPIIVIIGVFIYAARRAHIKHKARIKEINERYIQ
jgi:hypothetical protein